MNTKHILSKSTFMYGYQCPKRLFLHKFAPELRNPVSEAQQAIFASGTNAGILAQDLFPDEQKQMIKNLRKRSELLEKDRKAGYEKRVSIETFEVYEVYFESERNRVRAEKQRESGEGEGE